MSDFTFEFSERLQREFGATEHEANRVAEQAEQFLLETGADETVDSIIEKMKKRRKDSLIGTWNTTVGFMHGSSWDIGGADGGDNPYKF